jgi:uncharacterized linocin/CFP29 family protein
MEDILKRSMAPIIGEAWAAIDGQAKYTIEGNLSARRMVDIDGPHGWAKGAVNTGRVLKQDKRSTKGITWGIRESLPLIEFQVPFTIDSTDLDDIARGAADTDLANVEAAAVEAARFEERALYYGLEKANIRGIISSSENKPVKLGKSADTYETAVENAVVEIEKRGIGGPYDLVLGASPHRTMMSGDGKGFPLKERIERIIGGKIWWSQEMPGGAVVSRRGGDFVMTLGRDMSIGYAGHVGNTLELYITGSFTFRVLEPAAAVELKLTR